MSRMQFDSLVPFVVASTGRPGSAVDRPRGRAAGLRALRRAGAHHARDALGFERGLGALRRVSAQTMR